MERSCCDCEHWDHYYPDGRGECRRYPPQAVSGPSLEWSLEWHWPTTRARDWCSDWKKMRNNQKCNVADCALASAGYCLVHGEPNEVVPDDRGKCPAYEPMPDLSGLPNAETERSE